MYTCCSYICQHYDRDIDFDLKFEFTDFLTRAVPDINEPSPIPSDTNAKYKPLIMKEYNNLLDKLGLRKE